MDRHSNFYHINRCFILFAAASISLKGLLQPEYFALLLQDTGLVSSMISKPISGLFSLLIAVFIVGYITTKISLIPVIASIVTYLMVIGLALFQGLNIDCDCYQQSSIESIVYTNITAQFFVILVITVVTTSAVFFEKRQ
ncbi:MAG: hypothetical protein JKY55_15245 [Aliivibrio sp.]|uniref:MauE/DoxX family redox-associated membrane protein n=1 Tax=Aliivibrio sp. TaxID=1872443 RepID=UPI001A5F899D|nr:hypothetical protein [Aliivibrio sp.]